MNAAEISASTPGAVTGTQKSTKSVIGQIIIACSGKVLESGYLYTGSPTVKIRALSKEQIDFLRYSAEHYVRVKDGYKTTNMRNESGKF